MMRGGYLETRSAALQRGQNWSLLFTIPASPVPFAIVAEDRPPVTSAASEAHLGTIMPDPAGGDASAHTGGCTFLRPTGPNS
jgi:hypothetical protein